LPRQAKVTRQKSLRSKPGETDFDLAGFAPAKLLKTISPISLRSKRGEADFHPNPDDQLKQNTIR